MKSKLKIPVSILVAPIGIFIGMIVFFALLVISIPISVSSMFAHRKWVREMRDAGRVRLAGEFTDPNVGGTLIVDQPGFGAKKYCWWTPDDIKSISPFPLALPLMERTAELMTTVPLNDRSFPFDEWVYRQYLDKRKGSAFLVALSNGEKVANQLSVKLANVQIVHTWSAPCREFGSKDWRSTDST